MPEKTILITGCSSGIGLCVATQLKNRGYRVFGTARMPADLDKLTSLGINSVQMELNDPASIQRGLDAVLEKTSGTLDALFNNAGYLIAGAVEDLTHEMMLDQFKTNVFGPMTLTQMVLPIMRQQGHGRILFNSSILGIVTIPYYSAYNASKFALEGFVRTLRQEMLPHHIQVSLINPGPIQSQLRQHAFEHYQKTLQNLRNSAYQSIYKKLEKNYFLADSKQNHFSTSPELVTKKVLRALESRHPKLHYYVGWPAQLICLAKSLLPNKLLDNLLANVK